MENDNDKPETDNPSTSAPCYLEQVLRFQYRDQLPPEDECGLCCSPRRSHLDTAVVLSPEDYDALLRVRDKLLQYEVGTFAPPQVIAQQCRDMLEQAGFGKAGRPNTLWGMVRDACDEVRSLREKNR